MIGIGNHQLMKMSTGYTRPTVIDSTSNQIALATSITLTKPTLETIETGDLLIIGVTCTNRTSGAYWDDVTYKPTGFTLITQWCYLGGNVACFFKIADGTEGSTINVPCSAGTVMQCGSYVHIKGARVSDPVPAGNVRQQQYNGAYAYSYGQGTGSANDMIMSFACFDGGDTTVTFNYGGWSTIVVTRSGTGSNDCTYYSQWGDCVDTSYISQYITYNVSDNTSLIQIRIASI